MGSVAGAVPLGVALLVGGVASPALADVEPIGIEYQAAAGCPSKDEFTRQVLERTDSARLSHEPGIRTFVIEIEQADEGVHGSLSIREPDGTSSLARNLQGSHCSEVAMALALAMALAIDPQASFAPRTEEAKPEPPDPQPEPTFVEPVDEVPAPPPADSTNTFAAIALGPAFSMGAAPAPGFGGSLLGEGRFPGRFLASVGIELALLTVPTHDTAGASASFDFAHARPHACVLPFPQSGALRVMPCVGAELGIVRGRGSNLPRPLEPTRFWAAGTVGPRLLWDLAGTWFFDAAGNVLVPFTRYDFQFENPETTVHDAPSVALALNLHFGARL